MLKSPCKQYYTLETTNRKNVDKLTVILSNSHTYTGRLAIASCCILTTQPHTPSDICPEIGLRDSHPSQLLQYVQTS